MKKAANSMNNADILDIKNWKLSYETISRIAEQKQVDIDRKILKIDAINLYCLLKTFISKYPNGSFTIVEEMFNPYPSMPADRLIWWDFELKYGEYDIHIIRHSNLIEVQYSKNIGFEIEDFFEFNFKKYKKELFETLKSFSKYKLYENHFYSYKKFTDSLFEELKQIDICRKPFDTRGIDVIDSEMKIVKTNWNTTKDSLQNRIKYHNLSKAFILNLAFSIEAYINTLIRVLYTRDNSVDLKKTLNLQFKDKIKFLLPQINIDNKVIQDILKLINIRNKQVHSDLTHNSSELGYVYYDGNFPVFEITEDHLLNEISKKAYLVFSKKELEQKYINFMDFIELVKSNFPTQTMQMIDFLLKQEMLAFNVETKTYGVVFPQTIVSIFAGKEN